MAMVRRHFPGILLTLRKWYTVFLWAMILILTVSFVLVSQDVVVDVDLARAIVRGCGYDRNVLYLEEGSYFYPRVIQVGPYRHVMPGVPSIPSSITLEHNIGWWSWAQTVLTNLKSIRCVQSVLE